MAPKVKGPSGKDGGPVDPMADAPPPPTDPQPVIRPATGDAVPNPVPPAEPRAAAAPAAPSTYEYNFWRRLHLNVIGGYSHDTRYYIDADAYRDAAPTYTGGGFGIQPSVSFLQPGVFDLRGGIDFRTRFLSIPRSAGSVDSSAQMYNLGLLLEANLFFHEAIGIGANASLGYVFLGGNPVDVGAPHSVDFGGLGGFGLNLAGYVNFWRGAFRIGAGADMMPGGFSIPGTGTNPSTNISVAPQLLVFGGLDVFQIIRNASGGERFGAPQ